MRQEIKEQVHEPRDEFLRLREARHEAVNGSVPAGLALELRNVVGIGEKAHVEDQVCVGRQAKPEPEGDDGEQDRFSPGHPAKPRLDELPELVNIHPRRVDDGGRDLSHGLEQQALEPDALAHRQIAPQGVRAPRLPEAANQGAVRSLEKDERVPEVVARQALVHRRQLAEGFAPADVHHHGSALDPAAGLAAQLCKFGNQIDRQVVHTVETQVLERLQR